MRGRHGDGWLGRVSRKGWRSGITFTVDSNFAARMRKGERGRGKRVEGGEREAGIYTNRPDRLGGGWRGLAISWSWDEERPSPAPRTGTAEKGGCCSRPSQRVAPFHNSAPFDWTCRAWTGGEVDCIPTRGAPLCGTSCHLLARVRCSSRAGFRSLRKNGTRHPTPAPPHRTTHWTTGHVHRTLLVVGSCLVAFANLPTCVRGTCNGDHPVARDGRWTGHVGLSARDISLSLAHAHARTHARRTPALIMIALVPRAWLTRAAHVAAPLHRYRYR